MILAALGAASALAASGQPPANEPLVPTARAPIVVANQPVSRGHLRHWLEISRRSLDGDRHAGCASRSPGC